MNSPKHLLHTAQATNHIDITNLNHAIKFDIQHVTPQENTPAFLESYLAMSTLDESKDLTIDTTWLFIWVGVPKKYDMKSLYGGYPYN